MIYMNQAPRNQRRDTWKNGSIRKKGELWKNFEIGKLISFVNIQSGANVQVGVGFNHEKVSNNIGHGKSIGKWVR